MSSRSTALLARVALFALEALEPRTFLSAGDAGEPIPLDIEAGAHVREEFPNSRTVRFSFEAQAGVPYLFSTSYSWSNKFSLIDQDGQTPIFAPGKYERLEWTAPSSGTFFIEVSSEGEVPRAYTFSARILRDDYSDDPAAATPLPESLTISAHLDGPADQDWFSFQADPGHVYRIRSTSDELYEAWLNIYAPDGSTVYDANDPYHDAPRWDIVLKPQVAGRYLIQATDVGGVEQDGPASGNLYSISVEVITDDASDTREGAAKWDIDQPLHGEMQFDGDRDYFNFDAIAGQTLVFEKTGQAELTLRDTDGSYIATASEYDVRRGRLVWVVPETGTYSLSLFAGLVRGGYQPSSYEVRANFVNPSRITTISPEAPVEGALTSSADVNLFQFDAKMGSLYTFEISAQDQLAIQYLIQVTPASSWVYFYSGDNLKRDWPAPVELMPTAQWVARYSGTYYVSVSGIKTITGPYTLSMHEISDDHGNYWLQDPTFLTPGTAQAGVINFPDDDDYFAFDGLAGHVYTIDLQMKPGGAEEEKAWLEIDDPTDSQQAVVDEIGGYARRVTFMAKYNSPFGVIVNGYGDPAYTVQVTEMKPGRPPRNSPSIDPGETVEVAIDAPQMIRYLRVGALQGMEYILTPGPQSPSLSVYVAGAAGEIEESSDSSYLSAEHEYHWFARETRTVYFAISGLDPHQTGTFAIHLEAAATPQYEPTPEPPAPPEPAKPPAPAPDPKPFQMLISEKGFFNGIDANVFRFHAMAGQTYIFKTILDTLDDSLIGLFDPATGSLMVNDDSEEENIADGQEFSSRIQWTASRTDDVYIIVSGVEGSWGSYKLLIDGVAGNGGESLVRVAIAPEGATTDLVSVLEDPAEQGTGSSLDESDGADVWNDSGDRLDADAWDEEEDLEEI